MNANAKQTRLKQNSEPKNKVKKLPVNLSKRKNHWRFIGLDKGVLEWNVAKDQKSKVEKQTVDLKPYGLLCPTTANNNRSMPKLRPLLEFPELVGTLLEILNYWLYAYGNQSSSVRHQIPQRIFSAIRYFRYFSTRGKYRLQDVSQNDIAEILRTCDQGWASILKFEDSLEGIRREIKEKPEILDRIINIRGNDIALKNDGLDWILGYPMYRQVIPPWFREYCCAEISIRDEREYCSRSNQKQIDKLQQVGVTPLKNMFGVLNDMSMASTDRIQFRPVFSAKGMARSLSTKVDGRTENISLEDAVSVMGEAVKWIYDYSPDIIHLVNKFREFAVESYEDNPSDPDANTERAISGAVTKKWRDYYSRTQKQYDFPWEVLGIRPRDTKSNNDDTSLTTMVFTLITACVVTIGINNGRRKRELTGEKSDYGLYFGCVSSHESASLDYEFKTIDIYIEKTLQEYRELSINNLSHDAVGVLEALYNATRPVGTEPQEGRLEDIDEARAQKLTSTIFLTRRGFSGVDARHQYRFTENSKWFFQLCGVKNQKITGKTHTFRRLFAMLYFWRFKDARIEALSQHLCHLDYLMTQVYLSDPELRAEAESIERLYKVIQAENKEMNDLMGEVRIEFSEDAIRDILEGRAAGGFAKRIRNLHNRMTRSISPLGNSQAYKDLPLEEQASVLSDIYNSHKHEPDPRRHGICWADAHHNGNCKDTDTGLLAKENGVPELCIGCPFHSYSDEYTSHLRDDLLELEEAASNYGIPKAQRTAARKAADNLHALINLEEHMLEKAGNND